MPPTSPLSSLMAMAGPETDSGASEAETPDNTQSTEKPPQKGMETCIKAPEGMKTPSGNEDGATFEGTFRGYLKDGKLYFRSVNNIPVPGSEDRETKEDEDSESTEEENNETKMGMEDHPMEDEEDKKFKKKQKEDNAFKKAFHS